MKNRLLILSIAACGLLAACGGTPTFEPTSYPTAVIEPQSRTFNLMFAAKVTGRQDVSVYPRVEGTLTQITVSEGQRIRKGQTLFVIDQRPFMLALQSAEAGTAAARAQLATAKSNYESNKMLYEKHIVSSYVVETAQNEYQSAQAQLAVAQAQEAQARTNLGYCTITSPVNGVVGTLPYRVGDLVGSGMSEPLTVVSDNSRVQARFSINEHMYTGLTAWAAMTHAKSVLEGAPEVQLRLMSGDIYPLKGKIISVSGVVDPLTGAVPVIAEFDNPHGVLTSGISAMLLYPEKYDSAIVIPQSAAYKLQDKILTYVVAPDSTARCVLIDIEETGDGQEYVVTSGLKFGDEIVTSGVNSLQEGVKVKY